MSSTMRAVLIKDGKGPIENLYIGEAPKPKPTPGQVLVKVCFRSSGPVLHPANNVLTPANLVDQSVRS